MRAAKTLSARQRWPIYTFLPFMVLMLLCDSRPLYQAGVNGQLIADLLVPLYLLLMMLSVEGRLRTMMLLTIPYSFMGEILCSDIVKLYTYKFGAIPIYVPFGHAIVFSTGFLIARHPASIAAGCAIRRTLTAFYLLALAIMAIFFHDTLSLVFGAVFFVVLYYRGWQPFYLIMGLIVLSVELVGTTLGCWAWRGRVMGVLTTTNPPVGAIVFYIFGDMLVVGTASWLYGRGWRARLPILGGLSAFAFRGARLRSGPAREADQS